MNVIMFIKWFNKEIKVRHVSVETINHYCEYRLDKDKVKYGANNNYTQYNWIHHEPGSALIWDFCFMFIKMFIFNILKNHKIIKCLHKSTQKNIIYMYMEKTKLLTIRQITSDFTTKIKKKLRRLKYFFRIFFIKNLIKNIKN